MQQRVVRLHHSLATAPVLFRSVVPNPGPTPHFALSDPPASCIPFSLCPPYRPTRPNPFSPLPVLFSVFDLELVDDLQDAVEDVAVLLHHRGCVHRQELHHAQGQQLDMRRLAEGLHLKTPPVTTHPHPDHVLRPRPADPSLPPTPRPLPRSPRTA